MRSAQLGSGLACSCGAQLLPPQLGVVQAETLSWLEPGSWLRNGPKLQGKHYMSNALCPLKSKNSLKIMYLYYLKNKTKPNRRQLQIKVGPLCSHPPIPGLFPKVTLLSGWCLFSEHSLQAATYLRGCSIVWFTCVCVFFDILNLILYLAFFTQHYISF